MTTNTLEAPKPKTASPVTVGPDILIPVEQKLDATHRCDAGGFKPTNLGTAVKDEKGRMIVATCGAQAYVVVEFVTGELEFCAYHFTKMADKLSKTALSIRDERAFVLPEKLPYKGNGLN